MLRLIEYVKSAENQQFFSGHHELNLNTASHRYANLARIIISRKSNELISRIFQFNIDLRRVILTQTERFNFLQIPQLDLLVLAKNLREVSLLADQAGNRLSEGHRKSIRIPANDPTGYLKGFVKIKQWKFS